jgi:hypothetical protein
VLLSILTLVRPERARALVLAIACLGVLDLLAAHKTLNHTASPAFYAYRPPIVDALSDLGHQRLFVREYLLFSASGPGPEEKAGQQIDLHGLSADASGVSKALSSLVYLYPPSAGRFDLESSYDQDLLGLYPNHLGALVKMFRDVEGTPAYVRLLRMGAVSRVVALQSTFLEELVPRATFESLYPWPARVFEVKDALPRCFVVSSSRIADGGAALVLASDPSFDPRREAILSSGSATPPAPGFAGSCAIETLIPDRAVLRAALSDPGFLVLVNTYEPGWHVLVDGQKAPLLRANVTFQGVALSQGVHRVELIYRPLSVVIGAGISLVTLLGGVAFLRL